MTATLAPQTGPEAAAWLAGRRCAMLFVEARFEPAFLAAAGAGPAAPRLWTRVAGFNINGGRAVDLPVGHRMSPAVTAVAARIACRADSARVLAPTLVELPADDVGERHRPRACAEGGLPLGGGELAREDVYALRVVSDGVPHRKTVFVRKRVHSRICNLP